MDRLKKRTEASEAHFTAHCQLSCLPLTMIVDTLVIPHPLQVVSSCRLPRTSNAECHSLPALWSTLWSTLSLLIPLHRSTLLTNVSTSCATEYLCALSDAHNCIADYTSGHEQSSSPSPLSKAFNFVESPGNTVKKRPRRRFDEIERLYACNWQDCNKAYGTLNHLNSHVQAQNHGAKRDPSG